MAGDDSGHDEDNNNRLAGRLPGKPRPSLGRLDRLVGTWRISGGHRGTDSYEWMEGGFYFIHSFDGVTPEAAA